MVQQQAQPVKILTTTLKSGDVVTAKQHDFGVYALTYTSHSQAGKAADKLRAQGVECEVIGGVRYRNIYVKLLSGYMPAEPRGQAETGSGGVHVQTWIGSASITDMTNAGQRGKRCRVLRVAGAPWDDRPDQRDTPEGKAARYTQDVLYLLRNLDTTQPFAMVRDRILEAVEQARSEGVPVGFLTTYDEEIKGIDAPRPKLTAGLDNVWSGSADENGIRLYDLKDVNQWTEITHGQTGAAAYAIACKVWPKVQQARTVGEAARTLSEAGARLHGYCAMD